MIQLKTKVTDGASPIIQFVKDSINPVSQAVLTEYGRIIKRNVAASFKQAQAMSRQSPITLAYKAEHGGSQTPLVETGALRDAIMTLDGIKPQPGRNQSKVIVSWDFPTAAKTGMYPESRQDKGYVYLRSVEDGISTGVYLGADGKIHKRSGMFKRPGTKFLERGIKAGVAEGNKMVKESLARLASFDPGSIAVPIVSENTPYKGLKIRMTPTLRPHGPLGVVMYLVPPTYLYKYVGMTDDFMGAWSGTFDEIHIYGYMRQYLWGKTGVTKKTTRRQFRRKLYGPTA